MATKNKNTGAGKTETPAKEYALAAASNPAGDALQVVDPAVNLEGDGFQQKTVRVISFKRLPVGALIEGTLLEVKPSTDPKIKNPLLLIQTKNGPKALVPCVTVLNSALDKDPESFIGHDLRIIYRGKSEKAGKGGKNAPNLFDVATRPPQDPKSKK